MSFLNLTILTQKNVCVFDGRASDLSSCLNMLLHKVLSILCLLTNDYGISRLSGLGVTGEELRHWQIYRQDYIMTFAEGVLLICWMTVIPQRCFLWPLSRVRELHGLCRKVV